MIDRRPENKAHVAAFVKKYRIQHVQVLAYHLQANGIVERGHQPITKALAHITEGGRKN